MSRLSPEARRIIQAARDGDEPTTQDRSRIRASLLLRLGAGAAAIGATSATAGVATAAQSAGAGMLGLLPKGILLVSALVVVGGSSAYFLGSSSSPSNQTPAVVSSALPPSSAAPHLEEVEPSMEVSEEPEERVLEQPITPMVSAAPSPTLEAEVQALKKAHGALREGRADEAISVLDQDAGDKEGALEQERVAMRVFALCKLGKTEEARVLAESFLAKWPDSPLAARVQTSCAQTR